MDKVIEKTKGFTSIEILIVLAILAIISGFLMAGFKNYAGFQQYNQAVGDVEFVLKQARLSARSAESDANHGVKFTTSDMTQFVGDTYNLLDMTNITTTYELVTLETSLTSGVDELYFSKLTGLPSATGTVIVHGIHFSASTTITITDSGVVEY